MRIERIEHTPADFWLALVSIDESNAIWLKFPDYPSEDTILAAAQKYIEDSTTEPPPPGIE